MSHDERTKRGLAVQQRLQEAGMDGMKFMKHRKVPDTASVVREFRDGSDEDFGPPMVAVRFPGKDSPSLLVSEKQLAAMAEQFGGSEEDAAIHLGMEMHRTGAMSDLGMEPPHGMHAGGKLHLSDRGREAFRQALAESTGMDVDPENLGVAIDALYGGSDDHNAVMLGSKGMYAVTEHEHAPGGRSVISALGEGLRGKADERLPLNITRTVVVRPHGADGKPEPDEDSEVEDQAFGNLARRFGQPRTPPKKSEEQS